MYRYVYAVDRTAFCYWDRDLPASTEQFLAGIDSNYFCYLALHHVEQLAGDDGQRAAISLRLAYHHSIETLFSLLGAMVQAPNAPQAWIPQCSNSMLRNIVKSLSVGAPILTQFGDQSITIEGLGRLAHRYCWRDDQPIDATGTRFGKLWSRLASDFLDPASIAEYRSLKHGFRIAPGGFTLRFGLQEAPGVPAPEAAMHTIGSSEHGSSFFVSRQIVEGKKQSHHLRLGRTSLNWRPEAMALRLQLVSWSINNVVGFLRCMNGRPPESITFHRPEDPDSFDAAWRLSVGALTSNWDYPIDPSEISAETQRDLLGELKGRSVPKRSV